MGAMNAREMAEMDTIGLEDALAWHLTSNHFPPVPVSMVPACIEAIDAGNAGDWEQMIGLPDGVGYRGLTVAPARAIIEAHHLDAWIDPEEI